MTADSDALRILRLFKSVGTEAWDLHAFLELTAGDDRDRREGIFDLVERLVEGGYLESRGSDFYTLTEKGMQAAQRGRIET